MVLVIIVRRHYLHNKHLKNCYLFDRKERKKQPNISRKERQRNKDRLPRLSWPFVVGPFFVFFFFFFLTNIAVKNFPVTMKSDSRSEIDNSLFSLKGCSVWFLQGPGPLVLRPSWWQIRCMECCSCQYLHFLLNFGVVCHSTENYRFSTLSLLPLRSYTVVLLRI